MKALFPMYYLNITQSYGIGSHIGTYAIDNAGKDANIENVYAPFDCIVRKVWNNGNTVWIESLGNVQWADGTIAKATMSFTHDNNVSDLKPGKIISQGKPFYQEGTSGNADGNHVHIECARGSFVGTGWFLNKFGWWTINNAVRPEQLLWLNTGVKVINSAGLNWKRVPAPSKPKETRQQVVTRLYKALLGRTPDHAGMVHYTTGFSKGMTEAQIKADIIKSAEYKKRNASPAHKAKYVSAKSGWGLSNIAYAAGYKDYDKAPRWTALAKLNGSNDWKKYNASLKEGQKVRVS